MLLLLHPCELLKHGDVSVRVAELQKKLKKNLKTAGVSTP